MITLISQKKKKKKMYREKQVTDSICVRWTTIYLHLLTVEP